MAKAIAQSTLFVYQPVANTRESPPNSLPPMPAAIRLARIYLTCPLWNYHKILIIKYVKVITGP